jgi:hypothetical protein
MGIFGKRNKYERIQYVRELGFNTEENILVRPTDNSSIYKDFIKKYKRISLRTFNDLDNLVTPHFPILTLDEALIKIPELQHKNIYCIVATPIDPKDCKFCGAAMKTGLQLFVDIADGPGTVRRVTHDGKIDRRYVLEKEGLKLTDDLELNKCLKQFKICLLEECIFEFSWYNHLVGYKKENLIVWEVTDCGNRKSGI